MVRWGLMAAIGLLCGCKSEENQKGETVSDALLTCLEPTTWYKDVDIDGFGANDSAYIGPACPRPPLHTNRSGDCNDQTSTVNPGATEICDGLDNDCNGLVDDDDSGVVYVPRYYLDADDDGYGYGPVAGSACVPPAGHVAIKGDCNDSDPQVNPTALEVMGDGIDNNCDGLIDKKGELSGTWTELNGESDAPDDWPCTSVWSVDAEVRNDICPECDLAFWVHATFDADRSSLETAGCPQADRSFGIALLSDVDGATYLGLVSLEYGYYWDGYYGYYYALTPWPDVPVDWDDTDLSFEQGWVDTPVEDGDTTTYQTDWWGFEGVVE